MRFMKEIVKGFQNLESPSLLSMVINFLSHTNFIIIVVSF